jgi:hypothetical protein
MKKFVVKRPRLVNYVTKPEKPITLYIQFAYRVIPITDKTKMCIVLYKVKISETPNTSYKKIYCRDKITVNLTLMDYNNMANTRPTYLFYDYASISDNVLDAMDLINNYNKNLNIWYDNNISVKLFTILNKIDNI